MICSPMNHTKMADASSFVLVDADAVKSDDENKPQFSQELQISIDKANLLHDRQKRIESLFHVKITEMELLQEDNKRPTKKPTVQWIKLTGTKDDCKDAAEYIRALCNPSAWLDFMYDPELHGVIVGSDILASNLASIEKQTKAALLVDSPGLIFIQGDELTMALADSLLCELVKENSLVGPQSPSHDSSVLDSMLQVKFSCGDLESTTDSNITNYGEEVKRALLLSLSAADTKNSESTINLDEDDDDDSVTEVVNTETDSSDHDEAMDTFLALARSKNYLDEEAKTVITQKGYKISDAEFVRALSTNRRMVVGTVSSIKHKSSEKKVTQNNLSSERMDMDIMQVTQSTSSSDDDIIDLRSDAEGDEFDDLPSRMVENTQSGATAGVSDASGAQSKKSKKKKKKKKSKQAGHDPVDAKDSVVEKPSSMLDIDFISLIPTASSSKQIATKNSATSTPQGSLASGELTSGVMQPVQSRKEKRRMAAASVDNADRSRSPLKPYVKDSPVFSTPHQFLAPRFPLPYQNDFQARNLSAVNPVQPQVNSTGVKFGAGPKLRYIVLDGSNIAMHHGRGRVFSCRGIQLAVNYFQGRGHTKITAIVPQWRRQVALSSKFPIQDQPLLEQLFTDGHVTFSPSRRIGNRNIVPYDDRFILELASQTQGIVVSNDNYRDLYEEKREFKDIIEKRLLPYTLVDDIFIVPEDPLGRGGPTLDQYLSMPSLTPLSVPAPVQKFFGNREMLQPYFGSSASSKPGFSGWARPPSDLPSTMSTTGSSWPSLHEESFRPVPLTYQPDSAHGGFPSRMNPPSRPRFNQSNQSNQRNQPIQSNQRSVPMTTSGGLQRSNAQPQVQLWRTSEKTDELKAKLLEVFPDNKTQINNVLFKYPQDESIEKLSAILIGMLDDSP